MKLGFIDKIGSVGSLLAAVACPACFPMLAAVGSAVGLSVLHTFEGKVFVAFQLLVAVALIGSIISYFNHRKVLPLLIGITSPILIFFGLYVFFHPAIIYSGLLGLAVASVMNLKSTIKCPKCGFEKEETMPTDACWYFYECNNCKARLSPKTGDCCVFCSYG